MTYQIADLPIVRAQVERAADDQVALAVDSAPVAACPNIADNPLVRAQLERHLAGESDESTGTLTILEPVSPPARQAGSIYPAKQLVLENGSYRVADHGE